MNLKQGLIPWVLVLLSACGSSPDLLANYRSQQVDWQDCKLEQLGDGYSDKQRLLDDLAGRVKCGNLRVPLDYEHPEAGAASIGVVRVLAQAGSASRRGAIFFSPGGPGFADPGMPLGFGWLWRTSNAAGGKLKQVQQYYDLLGWSPRGSPLSTPLECRSDELEPVFIPASNDRSAANVAAMLRSASMVARACLANPLTRHIHTDATARDLDLLRHVVGVDKLGFFGLSYATWLGGWYASLFPQHVGRFVLVGTTDLTGTFDQMWLNNVAALQRVFDDVLAPYAARHPQTFDLGADAAQVRRELTSLPPALLAAAVYGMEPGFHDADLSNQSLLILRAAKEMKTWLSAGKTQNEIDALFGNASNAWAALGKVLNQIYFERLASVPKPIQLTPFQSIHYAVQCNDVPWNFDAAGWLAATNEQAQRYSFYGGHFTEFPCTYWGGPVVTKPSLANAAQASEGFLILQSQFDPQTTAEGAMRSLAALPNASLVLVGNSINHVVMVPYGSDCIDQTVADYFLDGVRPERLKNCPGKLLPADQPANP